MAEEDRMHGQNLVAVYSTRSQAEAARSRLVDSGIAANDIRLSVDEQDAALTGTAAPQHERGFLDWLFGTDIPDEHQTWYSSNLRGGRTALSVYVRGESSSGVHDILEEFEPLDVESQGSAEPAESETVASDSEQIIPVAKEELEVGKRETERRYRIRTYVVERPVEEQVHLRDERVVVERRPVSDERTTGDQFQEREFEVVERHEEPVIAKKARAVEEVVVHKDVKDRVETVHDRVRETKVDIDKGMGNEGRADVRIDRAAAGNKPAATAGSTGAESGSGFDQRVSGKDNASEDMKDTLAPDGKP